MSYQPRWSAGKTTGRGQRDCAGRYEAIRAELATRGMHGFTALDLGAYTGYFSLRLAMDFDAKLTAVDNHPALTSAVRHDRRVTALPARLSAAELRALGRFDVTLCLSVLHHIPPWRETLAAVRDISTALFIETAVPSEVLPLAVAHCPDIEAEVAALGGRTIALTPGYRNRHLRPLRVVG